MDNKIIFIYKATNLINGKVYVGQTVNLNRRISQHCKSRDRASLITRAIQKYGIHNIVFEIVDYSIFRNTANEMEVYYIKKLKTRSPLGYNLTDGGYGTIGKIPWNKGKKGCYTEEQRRRMSQSKIGKFCGEKNPFYGRKHSKETSRKMSAAKIGKRPSEETRKKMGDARRGVKFTEEHKQKLSNARKLYFQKIEGQGAHRPPLEN